MAATVTSTEVKDGFTTTTSDAEIDMFIAFANTADTCLDNNSVPDNTVKLMKLAAVRHMLTLQSNDGNGPLQSQSAPSGAGRSFQNWNGGTDINATRYGSMLNQMDVNGCLVSLLTNDIKPDLLTLGTL